MFSRLLVRLFCAIALIAAALFSAPRAALADEGTITSFSLPDDNGTTVTFLLRDTAESAALQTASSSGSSGASSLSNVYVSDIELSGSAGSRSLNSVYMNHFWLKPNSPTYSTLTNLFKPSDFYIKFPSYLVTGGMYDTPDSYHSIYFGGSLGSSSLSLTDSDGFSMSGSLGARSLALSESGASNSAAVLCDFIALNTGNISFSSGTTYTVSLNVPDSSLFASYLGGRSLNFYSFNPSSLKGTRVCGFNPDATSIRANGRHQVLIDVTCYSSYSGSARDLLCNMKPTFGVGVTQSFFSNKTDEQTDTLMNTDGSSTLVSNIVGDHSASDMADSLGVGDALQIATGGFTSVMGKTASGVVRFDGLSLGADYGNFEIPAFTVDIWSWCPESLATVIKTAFTALAVVSWAQGMKRFFDRIFHGEMVVSAE